MFRLQDGRLPTSVVRSAQCVQVGRFLRARLHQEPPASGGNTMSDAINRQVLLVEKPTGKLGPEHFKMSKAAIPEPKDGEALLRVRNISLDAAKPGMDARRDL